MKKDKFNKTIENFNLKILQDTFTESKRHFKPTSFNHSLLDFKIYLKIKQLDNVIKSILNNSNNYHDFIANSSGYKNTNYVSVIDQETGLTVTVIKNKDKIIKNLILPLDCPNEISISHHCDNLCEEIVFEYYNEMNIRKIKYNLTNACFSDTNNINHKANGNDKKFVIQSLDKYINKANSIIINKSNKNSNSKQKKLRLSK